MPDVVNAVLFSGAMMSIVIVLAAHLASEHIADAIREAFGPPDEEDK